MLKRLAILGVLLGVIGAWPQVPPNGSQQSRLAQSKKNDAKPIQPSRPAVQVEARPLEQKTNADPGPSGYPWHDLWAPPNIPNWLLVGVGITASLLALRTLKAIWKQTELQKIAYTQWVVVRNWRSEMMNETTPARYSDGSPVQRMRIQLDIINESLFPMTLTDSVIAFKGRRSDDIGTLKFYLPENFPLFPNVPYLVDVSIVLNKDEAATFESGIMFVKIEGNFIYKGVLKRTEHYPLHGLLWCGRAGTRFDAEIPNRPEDKKAIKRNKEAN